MVRFAMNKPIEDRTLDGRKVEMVMSQKSENRWIEKQRDLISGKESTIIRDFMPDRMMVNLTAGAARSFSTFVRRIKKD